MRLLARFLGLFARAAGWALGLRAVSTVLAGLAPVLSAWLARELINHLIAHRGTAAWLSTAALAATATLIAILQHVNRYADQEITRRVALRTQAELFTALTRLPGLAELENPQFQDRLRLAQQIGQGGPQQLIGAAFGLAQSAVLVGGFLVTLIVASPVVAPLVLLSALPMLWAQLKLSRQSVDMSLRITPNIRRQMFYSMLLLDTRAAKEIRLFGLGDFLRGRMLTELTQAQAGERRIDRTALRVNGLLSLLTGVVSTIALIVHVNQIAAGRGSVGDIAVLIAALASVQSGLAGIVTEIATANEFLLLFGHYVHVTTVPVDTPAGQTEELPTLRGAIELRDVWFRYHPDHDWVLRGVNLTIPAGESLALVGLNGAGKSTLVKLICRLYEPTRGTITWDGTDISEVDVAQLRKRIGVVFQDYMSYELSAAENIALGDLDALTDEPRLRAAAAEVDLDDTITALPRGYQTMLSRVFEPSDDHVAGVVLSGGQWQRVAIARAVIRSSADLLILDEPSAGLDAAAEHSIHESLRRLRQGRSSLLISHRLNAVRQADRIVVLDGGVVTEQGTHDILMAVGGAYAALFRTQAGGYQLVPDTAGAKT
ncbi:ABC transporter ATP-binding protein [Dactylosporangium fulvum]|uniref:ABC transporter ATP-binding protein/permease n=1 Tax=Dactylosporangium fulvum TaxID=53359 RepID=A0ABY5W186_9ACTN|nr:ABC transporter ATP-binding protein [Dactylosporangium fulvum]UWP83214.1 ABC transporter ATP-binding protein/permease [Dactylosporangium fulvum]